MWLTRFVSMMLTMLWSILILLAVLMKVSYTTHIYESNSGLGLISSYSPATTIAIISSTQVELPASSPSHLVQLFNVVKLLSFDSGATFGISTFTIATAHALDMIG
jgi:hypothetical protein